MILVGLYSNPLTWASQLFFSQLDKGKTPRTGRLCKFLKVTVSLTTGSPRSFYPRTLSSYSHSSPEHVWVIELRGKKVGKWPWKPQSQSRQGQRCHQPPLNSESQIFSIPFNVTFFCTQIVKLVGQSVEKKKSKSCLSH